MQHCRPSLQEARSAWALSALQTHKKRWDQDKHPQSQGSLARMLRIAAEDLVADLSPVGAIIQ
jgi:hypothetical protein